MVKREAVEKALRESEERYRSLVELSPYPIIIHSDGKFDYLNAAGAKLFGASKPEEIIGKPVLQFIHPDFRENVGERIRQVQQGKAVIPIEEKFLRLDGTVVDVEAGAIPFTYQGRQVVHDIAVDITERTIELKSANEQYKNLVELTSDIIYVSDRDGNQIFMNDAGYRILEVSPGEIIGQPWSKWIHPDDREKTIKKFIDMITLGTDVFKFENRYVSKSGRVTDVLHNVRVLRNEKGEVIGTQGIARDITERKRTEAALEAAVIKAEDEKNKTKAIIEAIGDGIIIQDTDYKIIFQNQIQKELYGDHVGEYCYKAYENRDIICDGCPVELSFKDGKIHRAERKVLTGKGIMHYELTGSPLRDSSGKIIAGIKVIRDITEYRQTEEALREKERFLAGIFASIQDGIGILDKDLNIIRVNPTAEKWYPHASPLVGKKCYEAFHGRREPCDVCPARCTLKTGESAHEVVPKHGPGGKEIGWLEIYSYPLIDVATGQMNGVIEYVRDISERKKLEEMLKLLSEAVENAPDGVQIVGLDGRIIYSNKAIEEIYGFSPEDLKGKHVNEMNADPEFAGKVILPTIEQSNRWVGELSVKHRDGKTFPIWLKASMVKNSKGEPMAMVGIIRDITARKKAEEAIKKYAKQLEESNRLKDLFTDIMRHDLLNPLSVASGYNEILHDVETDPQKKTSLEAIQRNLIKALDMIESATMLSKIESAESIELESLDLKGIIEKVMGDMTPLADRAGMIMENTVNRNMPVRANKIIEEVFANLLSNAIKYAPKGKRIVIEGNEIEAFWRIRVKDFGDGINDADKTVIFERFRRQDKKGVKGTGLGLAIARKIVELHKGRIWVEDNPEGGAIFVVEIPK